MENGPQQSLIQVIDQSAEELHRKIDHHCALVASILEQGVGGEVLKRCPMPCVTGREQKLKQTLKETVEVLEETKKAFKSKRLEVLRKKIMQVLIDAE